MLFWLRKLRHSLLHTHNNAQVVDTHNQVFIGVNGEEEGGNAGGKASSSKAATGAGVDVECSVQCPRFPFNFYYLRP